MVTLEKIFELAVTFVWVQIISNYFNTFLTYRSRNHKFASYVAWGLYWICENFIIKNIVDSLAARIIYTIVIWVAIGFVLYQNKVKTTILVAVSFYCSTAILEGIVAIVLVLLGMQLTEYAWTGLIISRIIIVMIIQIIRINHKTIMNGEVTLTYWAMSVLTPIGSIVIIYVITVLTIQIEDIHFSIMSSFALFIMLVLNIFIFSVYDKLQKEATIRQNNIMYEQQAKMYKLQSEEREAIWLESRKLHHDFKNHLICLKGYSEEQQYQEMEQYLKTLTNDYIKSYWKNKSGNLIIDSLLNYKMKKAESANIVLNTEFQIPNRLPFDDADLCIIVGNTFDNSIEAMERVPEEERNINLNIKFNKNVFYMKITNPYSGEIQIDTEGRMLTLKKNKEFHGIGMGSIEKAVREYNGTIKIEKENNLFQLMIVMYGKPNNMQTFKQK